MPSTYSKLGLELMATGEKNNAWGTINNTNVQLLEETGSGVATVTIGSSDYDLAISQGVPSPGRNMVVIVISSVSLSTTAIVKVPQNTPKVYAFHNMTTGNQSILVKTTAGTGVEIAPEGKSWVYATSTSVVEIGFNNVFFNVWNGNGNGVVDNASDLRTALSVAAANGDTLYVPPGTYLLASTVTIPASIGGLVMAPNATFLINHASIGLDATEGTTRRNRQKYVIDVIKNTQSDWTSEESIGFRAANFFESDLHIRRTDSFTIGFQSLGDGTGNSYNDILLGRLANNKIAVDVRTSGASSWNNENLYRNGRLAVSNGVNVSIDRTGIRFSAATVGSYQNHNQNIFLKPSFELDASISCQTYAVRDEVASKNNAILYARAEDCSKNLVYFVSGSEGNVFQLNYNGVSVSVEVTTGAAVDGSFGWYIEDTGLGDSLRSMRTVYSLPKLNVVSYVSGAGVRGLNVQSLSAKTPGTSVGEHAFLKSSNLTGTTDGILIGGSRAVGVYVNTEEVKRFSLNWGSDDNSQGRQVVWCYDASDNLIDTSATPVRSTRGNWVYSTGHYWSPQADQSGSKSEFVLPEIAKRAFIGVRRGSVDVSMDSFHLDTPQYRAPTIYLPKDNSYAIETVVITTATSVFTVEVPVTDRLILMFDNFVKTGIRNNIAIQFSIDGGNSYVSSTTYYNVGYSQSNTVGSTYGTTNNHLYAGTVGPTGSYFNSRLELGNVGGTITANVYSGGFGPGEGIVVVGTGNTALGSNPSHLKVFDVGAGNFTQGKFTLKDLK